MVEQQLRRTSNNQDASIVELVESARVIAEGSFERWAQTYKNAASESDFLERELQVLQIRFDLLLMFAILLADKALFEQSLDALQLAISIYEKGDGKPAASEAKGYALNEALYLEGIVRRLMWRKDIESLKAQERLDSGNRRLQDHIRKINELLGENGRRGKRLRVFLVAFQRELRGFATRNNLQPEGIWPISLQGALETLQQVIQESLNERAQFHYVTLRACQHWLAYSRMLEHSQIGPNNDIGALPRSQQIEVFKAFKLELDKLRRDLERLGADRHYSIFVTELSGMIKFQLELDFSRKDIANALSFLENLNCPDNRLGLSQNAAQVKAEARTLLER